MATPSAGDSASGEATAVEEASLGPVVLQNQVDSPLGLRLHVAPLPLEFSVVSAAEGLEETLASQRSCR